MRPFRAWLIWSLIVLSVSVATGYRASVAARAPQYLFTKTRVVVERTAAPEDEQEAEIQRRFAEAGEETAVSELEPMFVLGLLDGALPLIAAGGLPAIGVALLRRRIAKRTSGRV